MRRVGALVFPGFELLDVFGPLEMFGLLGAEYALTLVAENPGPVRSGQGPSAFADATIGDGSNYDILFVPGGPGTRREVGNTRLLDWISRTSECSEFCLTVCTGSALLARAGVLNGRSATTNKMAFAWVMDQGPKVQWVKQARWVEDGKFLTSSGVSAGMDMALGAISVMHGVETAHKVAGWAEYAWNRDRNLDPFAKMRGLL
jgi:transcriptional regulator GlxA family with amidase domain